MAQQTVDEKPAEESYKKTEREIARARRLENRDAWAEHHGHMASYHYRAARYHLAERRRYEGMAIPE